MTHDRWFLERFGGEVWSLLNGTLTAYAPGTYTQHDATGVGMATAE